LEEAVVLRDEGDLAAMQPLCNRYGIRRRRPQQTTSCEMISCGEAPFSTSSRVRLSRQLRIASGPFRRCR
jgi:hypothetical protein